MNPSSQANDGMGFSSEAYSSLDRNGRDTTCEKEIGQGPFCRMWRLIRGDFCALSTSKKMHWGLAH